MKLFIFDVDGVLRNSSGAGFEGMRRGFESLGLDFNMSLRDYRIIRSVGKYNNSRKCISLMMTLARSGIRDTEEIYNKKDLEGEFDRIIEKFLSESDDEKIDKIRKFYKEFTVSDKASSLVYIFPMVEESLNLLLENGFRLAIWSNTNMSTIERDLGRFLDKFSVVIGGEDLQIKKPSPDGILKVCRELNIGVEDTAYVGDAVVDVQAARNAGCKSIVILADVKLERILREAKADHYFRDLQEMVKELIKKS